MFRVVLEPAWFVKSIQELVRRLPTVCYAIPAPNEKVTAVGTMKRQKRYEGVPAATEISKIPALSPPSRRVGGAL